VAKHRPFDDPRVKALFDTFPRTLRADVLTLRDLIFDTASRTDGVGALTETLKWGQPAYLPRKPRTGSTIRIGALSGQGGRYAMFVHCQTTLVSDFRLLYEGQLAFEGNRAIALVHGEALPRAPLQHCIALALTYHARPRRR
jgi:hypothetical protein